MVDHNTLVYFILSRIVGPLAKGNYMKVATLGLLLASLIASTQTNAVASTEGRAPVPGAEKKICLNKINTEGLFLAATELYVAPIEENSIEGKLEEYTVIRVSSDGSVSRWQVSYTIYDGFCAGTAIAGPVGPAHYQVK